MAYLEPVDKRLGDKLQKYRKASKLAKDIAFFLVILVFLSLSGIGCPIKSLIGISCPGCGMTRAWLAALTLRFDLALAYHPLFWLVPILFVIAYNKDRLRPRVYMAIMCLALVALIVVWLVRLATPREANVLFSGLLTEDVVSVDTPAWLQLLRLCFAF